jgi:hypothetical protein
MQTARVETKVFRVEQFRNPAHPPERLRELEADESLPLDMSVEAVLRTARARTGLEDFGPLDFVDRLSRLLREVEGDQNVWKTWKRRFLETCAKAAANRLKNRAFLEQHPQIDTLGIERPTIVIGLPRSGTTHLENLIAADRRLRYLPVYLGAEAVPTPGEKAGADGRDPRWIRSDQHWQHMKANPIMAAMHEHSPDHACGENELQLPDFASYQWEWLADVPGWRDFYFTQDQTPHFEYARTILKAIAFQFPNDRRWILKGNAHSEQLRALMKVYPDATIVMNHRDPLAILQSVLTMRGLAVLSSQKVPDVRGHVKYWVDRIERMLRAYMRDRAIVPANQRVELLFQDIIADDVGSAQMVLERAGLPATNESMQDMRSYMDHHPRGRAGRVVYDMAGDFGLDVGALRERFRFYTDEFAVRLEVQS